MSHASDVYQLQGRSELHPAKSVEAFVSLQPEWKSARPTRMMPLLPEHCR